MVHGEILLVEDSPAVLRPLVRIIEQMGYRTRVAMSRSQMRKELAKSGTLLSAVLDYSLPDAPDGEALQDLLQAGIPTLILTARNDTATREKILSYPVVDYIPKDMPAALEYVAMLVRRLDRNRHLAALVVDDSRTVRQHLKALLERYQFQVILAADADAAKCELQRHPHIRLALIDHDMPGMDGANLTAEIRRSFGRDQLAIIGISGSSDSSTTARFIKAGADDFLRKPFNPEEFYCRITRNIEYLESIEALLHAAHEDALTGLPNRRAFFAHAMRQHGDYAVAMLDIDHFKSINDRCGHAGGDEALVQLAQQLRSHFPDEMAARLGGEEFAIILTGDTRVQQQRLEKFRQAVASRPLDIAGKSVEMHVSIGLSDCAQRETEILLHQADEHLYLAKQGGRNCLVTRRQPEIVPAG
ncbi:response regulator [Craterilacuibacter sp.]|uniref:response regulator n=1 Tax=Craterilacuibacter sp. TaxID=2870909 RepID=UPI003F33B7AB